MTRMQNNKNQVNEPFISDEKADELVAELAADGIVVSREEARRSIERLAELLLLISEPLPLPPPSGSRGQAAED